MLDKSVPFLHILMKRDKGAPIPAYELPNGYTFQMYRPGDERDWAKIEASAGEFEGSEMDAYIYFRDIFLPVSGEMERRCLFVTAPDGEKAATATAFWSYTGVRRILWVHWVSCKPKYQGLGLGKAVIFRVIELMREIEGDQDMYLHTQTWSHKAVGIYEKAGFYITREPGVGGYMNDEAGQAAAFLQSLKHK